MKRTSLEKFSDQFQINMEAHFCHGEREKGKKKRFKLTILRGEKKKRVKIVREKKKSPPPFVAETAFHR